MNTQTAESPTIGNPQARLAAQRRQVDAWNRLHPVGTKVVALLDNGQKLRSETTAPATLLGGHTAVAWLKDMTGCYKLDRVTVVQEAL
jgi:hypothetical protein